MAEPILIKPVCSRCGKAAAFIPVQEVKWNVRFTRRF